MRIGIVADIHDAVDNLRRSLVALREHGAEQIVTLGDAFETYLPNEPASKVAALLEEAGAVGVWGNHDFGLSHDVLEAVRLDGDPAVLRFAAALKPHLVLGDCRFSHIEPWKDPYSLTDLWLMDGLPITAERAMKSFDSVPERVLFVGHFHSWIAATPQGVECWSGSSPIDLPAPGRYLVSIGAVLHGWCALYDTDRFRLTPLRDPSA